MVVDDDLDIRAVMEEVLSAEGFEVVVAGGGAEALEMLRQAPRKPDLILLDLMMPGMGGDEFRAQQLKDALLADIPVVILSAANAQKTAKSLKAKGHIQKPFDFEQLIGAVRQYLVDG
jgi:CheY-like chemotaxis protein